MKSTKSLQIFKPLLAIVLAVPLMAMNCDQPSCSACGFRPNEQVIVYTDNSTGFTGVADANGCVDAPCGASVQSVSRSFTVQSGPQT